MTPTTTVADFIRGGREAGHDSLGIAHDPEALVTIAGGQRETFLRDRTEAALRRWRELVAEVAAMEGHDPAMARWLGIEHVRLALAFKVTALDDTTIVVEAARWVNELAPGERDDIVGRFELDLIAPFTAVAAGSRG